MSADQAPGAPSARRAVLGVFDQILYSVTNFALTAVVAHFSTTRAFGAYALLYATFLVCSGVNRGLVCEPLIIRYSTATSETWRTAAQISLRRSTALGLAVGVVLAVVSAMAPAAFRPVGFVFAIGLWIMFGQDCLRYAALARGRPTAALANDAAVLIAQILITSAIVISGAESPAAIVGAWLTASGLGGVVGVRALGLRLPSSRNISLGSEHRRLSIRLGADNAVVLTAQQGVGYVLAAAAGLAAAGGLRAAQTVYAPLATLTQGVQSAVVPELIRARTRSLASMNGALQRVALVLATVGVIFVVVAPIVPDHYGMAVFGPSWLEATPLLIYVGIGQIVGIPTGLAQAGLRALADGRRILSARLVGVILFGAWAFTLAAIFGARGAGVGVAIGSATQSIVWGGYYFTACRGQRNRGVASGTEHGGGRS